MTREFTPPELEAMNLATDHEDGEGDYADLIDLMIRTYQRIDGGGMCGVLAVVRAYDKARDATDA